MDKVIELFKKPSPFLFAISLLSGGLIFLNDSFLEKLYLLEFRNKFGIYIGAFFVVSCVVLLTFGVLLTLKEIKLCYRRKKQKNMHIRLLQMLTPFQKKVVVDMYLSDTRGGVFDMSDIVINYLEASCIVVRSSSISTFYTQFPYHLQGWVISYLDKHPEFVNANR